MSWSRFGNDPDKSCLGSSMMRPSCVELLLSCAGMLWSSHRQGVRVPTWEPYASSACKHTPQKGMTTCHMMRRRRQCTEHSTVTTADREKKLEAECLKALNKRVPPNLLEGLAAVNSYKAYVEGECQASLTSN